MENWTSLGEIRNRWTADEPPENDALLDRKIGQVERQIRRQFPDMGKRLAATDDAGELVEPDLAATIADVVADLLQDHFSNPLGLRTVQDTEGPWTMQQTVAGDAPGKLILSTEHTRRLSPPAAGGGSRLRSIDLEAGSYAASAAWSTSTADGWPR